MPPRRAGFLLLFLLASAPCLATGLDFNFGDDAAELDFYAGAGTLSFGDSEAGGGVVFNEEGDVVLSGGFRVRGTPGNSGNFEATMAIKAFGLLLDEVDEGDGFGLGIGGGLRYKLPLRVPIAVAAEAHFAPDIVIIGDPEGVLEIETRVEIDVLPNATGYVGYRWLEVELETLDYDVDENWHIGIRFRW